MSYNVTRDQRRGGLGLIANRNRQRQRLRLRPTLLALEVRSLLSTFTVTNTSGNPGPERTLSRLGNLGTCALIGLFVYRSLCCYIHGGARRTTDGGQSARLFG
jgi:hypothetical protein